MSRAHRRSTPRLPTVVFDFGGVLSGGLDPVPDLQELLGGEPEELRRALWAPRRDYDGGRLDRTEYWRRVAAGVGVTTLTEEQAQDLQEADNRYFLRLDPAARALVHDLARNRVRLALLSNTSAAFGQAVRRADWFEAFSLAVISGEEGVQKPDREIYEILLETLAHHTGGVSRPREVIYFDDVEGNVEAARELGIDAHLWPTNDGSGRGAAQAREILTDRGVPLE
ncbi:HAD family phosphatase [Brachybacterium sp. EF45031]|uniref:HAD family hydrolase n=1 Tax=Brachybacterium sillae TaxID=2810536 RepID=UPI00217ED390|nr:HAD family phosphatase [Brachybacterium sillae]MCS6712495.1 HAD family phosphatase [Brachybacterium sillae]